jgi:hypothetical protein
MSQIKFNNRDILEDKFLKVIKKNKSKIIHFD